MLAQDELTATACLAVQRLTPIKKAQFLLNTALALLEDSLYYGEEVETYLDVCLKTPDLPMEDRKRALLAQRNARASAGGQLATSPVQAPSRPPGKVIGFSFDPACHRVPPEIWDKIAVQTPRYHLRKWLFLSPLHRAIASCHLFHTVHITFKEYEVLDRGLNILDRAISDPVFASHVKSLHLHLDYEEGDASDLIFRILTISLRAFKALREFEWIGNLEMPNEMEQILTHQCLHGLGLKGLPLDVDTMNAFHSLRKFGFNGSKADKFELEDMINSLLARNEGTLQQLILDHCQDGENLNDIFESATIKNLTHLDLSAVLISGFVLNCIAEAENLQSLTLRGSYEESTFASQMFATNCIPLCHLESFRLVMNDDDEELYTSLVHFLWEKRKLQRLALGCCPWDLTQSVLPRLRNLRVLEVYIEELLQEQLTSFVGAIPAQIVALKLVVDASEIYLDEYAPYFTRFNTLSFLHLQLSSYPLKPSGMSNKDLQVQTDNVLHGIAAAIPSLDFLVWRDNPYIVVRSDDGMSPTVELKELHANSRLEYGRGADLLSKDIAWLQDKTYLEWNP